MVNQIKEQGQVSPGALDDLTVSVVINGDGYGSLRENQLLSLVGNAAGIAAADQREKIAIASAPFDGASSDDDGSELSGFARFIQSVPIWVFILIAVLLAVLVGVIVLLVIRKRKKEEAEEEETAIETLADGETDEEPVLDLNKELEEMKNDRSMELKRSIREFAEQNAEISAQLLKNWLNGGDQNGE